ncbi:transposase [Alkaliflexus imshenetskii]|uniref:transposase n=1 Tax=Alkaliflexus imshenetskii TaxID=286730 RepID=UPI0004B279FB|nr:transposase [Alkaliflexus imshenetskii]
MTEKFQNKYRIPSARLQNWDYRWDGAYFITICTQNRKCCFGEIENGKMILSEIGKIVETEWLKTTDLRPDMNLQLDAYVIMPNHFHAIIIIGKNDYNNKRGVERRDAIHCVSTTDTTTTTNKPTKNQFGPQSKNLASIIRGFKTGVTINARKLYPNFAWQPRFHDHIIRDNDSFKRIQTYILENPIKWGNDKFYNR